MEAWNRLAREGLVYDGSVNTRHSFSKMAKKFGKAYIDYLRSAWVAKEDLSEGEFCRLNGDVPLSFLVKLR